jgi:hypothetical protein
MVGANYPDAADYLVVINSGSAFRHHPLLFYGSQLVPVVGLCRLNQVDP